MSSLPAFSPVRVPAPIFVHTHIQPTLSPWRRDVMRTHLELHPNGRLYCLRPHPHTDCSGAFKLSQADCATLVASWSDAPLHSVTVSQQGKARCLVSRLPDQGVQLLRIDRYGKRAGTFRILAADVADFLALCRRAQFVS